MLLVNKPFIGRTLATRMSQRWRLTLENPLHLLKAQTPLGVQILCIQGSTRCRQ